MRMKISLLITFFSIFSIFQLKAQLPAEEQITELNTYFEEQYGPDQSLVSGIHYINMHRYARGHKFFGEDEFRKGKLVIDKGEFNSVFLKYNLLEQQVILQNAYRNQMYHEIIISNSIIREFELDGKVFRKNNLRSTDTLFYQILEVEDLACYYHWTKTLNPAFSKEYRQGEFHQAERKSYLLRNSEFHQYKGARSFSR